MSLKTQIKKMESLQKLEDDHKLMREQEKYQYFGKGGGGAPLRDKLGRVVTTRKPDPDDLGYIYGNVENDLQHAKGVVQDKAYVPKFYSPPQRIIEPALQQLPRTPSNLTFCIQ